MTRENSSAYSQAPSKVRVTVDIILFKMIENYLSVLLVKRKYAPFKDQWAIPGGFVHDNESLDEAARRELQEETGLKNIYFEQLYTFGDPGRDPRGQVITVAYMGLIPQDAPFKISAGSDASQTKCFPMNDLPLVAFDHKKILKYAQARLINKLEYTTAGFRLLAKEFTLTDLQSVYEAVLEKTLDKRNFRRKVALLDILKETSSFRIEGAQRPARLYQLSNSKFEKLKNKGILFPF